MSARTFAVDKAGEQGLRTPPGLEQVDRRHECPRNGRGAFGRRAFVDKERARARRFGNGSSSGLLEELMTIVPREGSPAVVAAAPDIDGTLLLFRRSQK